LMIEKVRSMAIGLVLGVGLKRSAAF